MKKILTLMLVCLIGLSAMAGRRHSVTVVSADENLQFIVFVNNSQKHKSPAKKVTLSNMKAAKDYTVSVKFDNLKIMHPAAELTLTNVTEDMELVAFVEGQQAYIVTRADYEAIQAAKKAARHSCGGCSHSCGGHGTQATKQQSHSCSGDHSQCSSHKQPSDTPEKGRK